MKRILSWIVLAALLAAGAVSIGGCASGDVREVESGDVTVQSDWTPIAALMDAFPGMPIRTNPDKTECSFALHACEGSFAVVTDGVTEYHKDISVKGGELVYWSNAVSDDPAQSWTGSDTFVEVRITEGEHYVGYAVIRIALPSTQNTYIGKVIRCIEFPSWLGIYQEITEEWLDQRIEDAKANA
ncbi:MAG: hypothetical protein Q4B99_03515 [Clostridia bacterium]|nr:hypothetical protein [Clostridia bacterium]